MHPNGRKTARPLWWTRQYTESFALSEEEAWGLINSPPWYCVISWVTKDAQPVSCAMAYVVLDGKIMLTSTANRDKVKAFLNNPATSLCFHRGLTQVTVRGRVELSSDAALVQRWVAAHFDTWDRPLTEEKRKLQFARYASPDRLILVVHAEKIRSFDGGKMFRAEAEEDEIGELSQ